VRSIKGANLYNENIRTTRSLNFRKWYCGSGDYYDGGLKINYFWLKPNSEAAVLFANGDIIERCLKFLVSKKYILLNSQESKSKMVDYLKARGIWKTVTPFRITITAVSPFVTLWDGNIISMEVWKITRIETSPNKKIYGRKKQFCFSNCTLQSLKSSSYAITVISHKVVNGIPFL